jgi:class 3 adenylate cyclase
VGLVVLLTGLTGAIIGGVAWRDQRARSRALLDAAMAQAARLTAAHADRVLEDAAATARLGAEMVQQGQLHLGDDRGLERFTLAVLHAHPHLSWVSYGDRLNRFLGAWRDPRDNVYVNKSFPYRGRIRLEEDRILPDGRREPVRRSDDHRYRPTERPYFRAAEARRGTVWTEPYEFYAGGGLGVTCAAPVLDVFGGVKGVFTVDFSLDRLAGAFKDLQVSSRGRVFVATAQGALLVGREGSGASRREVIDAELAAAAMRQTPVSDATYEFEHQGETYLARAVPISVGDLQWVVEVVVPATDYTEQVDAEARVALALGLLALLLAAAGGVMLARWIARPLQELARHARRIRHGDLSVTVVPRSRDEIGVLARAMGDMVQALRDRDFIRETFGRYVSPELAEQCLRDRDALQLGGEVREVAMLMSDLRGFSELSERLGAPAMIGLLNQYLAKMTPVIIQHGGIINEFIGDAIFVLFGAPFGRPDDAERAVRCAHAMQQALSEFNADNRRRGLPELSMGIGLHVGPVVAGNIGSTERVKYGVVGPAVNLVARIQALTLGGEVLLSDAIRNLVASRIEVGPGRLERFKGVRDAVLVYRLLAVADEQGRSGAQPRVTHLDPVD